MSVQTLLLGWSLAVLSSVTVVPQLAKLRRSRNHDGLSLPSATIATVTMFAWCCYTLAERDWPALGSSVVPFAVWGTILVSLSSLRRDRTAVAALAIAGLGSLLVLLSGQAQIAAAVGSVCWIIPQGWRALQSAELTGVSVSSYLLIFVENAGWVAYAFATGRMAYAAAPVVQLPLAVVIAVLAWRAQRSLPDQPHRRATTIAAP